MAGPDAWETVTPGCIAMKVKPSPLSSFASCTVTARSRQGSDSTLTV